MKRVFCIFIYVVFCIFQGVSAELTDTLNHYGLQAVEIRGKRLRSQLREIEGTSIISMSLMDEMPHILGNADPLHYAQLLPGVQPIPNMMPACISRDATILTIMFPLVVLLFIMRLICWASSQYSMRDILQR